jgi:serine/threonine protein kinase
MPGTQRPSSPRQRLRYCPLCDRDLPDARCPEHDVPTVDLTPGSSTVERAPVVRATFAEHYSIEREIGTGLTGQVFLARQHWMSRPVAIKVIHGALLDRGPGLRRFYREAQAMSLLEHPNIVRVLDFGVDEVSHCPYIAMNLIEGRSLAEIIAEAPLSEPRAAGLLAQVARALVAAHAKEIIHRDLKPANILVRLLPEGEEHATVIDFGLARGLRPDQLGITQEGTLVGTPAYVSPEQVRGEAVDGRSDLYSLGCILYECLTGEQVYQGATGAGALVAHLFSPPPPLPDVLRSGERPSVALRLLLNALLEKKREDRPESARSVMSVLALLAQGKRKEAEEQLSRSRPKARDESTLEEQRDPAAITTPDLEAPSLSSSDLGPFEEEETETVTSVTATGTPIKSALGRRSFAVRISEGGTVISLPEMFDERFVTRALTESLRGTGPIVFDFERVQSIKSIGVREWFRLIGELPEGRYYCFVRCHPQVVSQFNAIEGFGGRGELVSIYVPFECRSCDARQEILLDLTLDCARLEARSIPAVHCSTCSKDMELEEIPEVYFDYALKSPRPRPPEIVSELIGGSSQAKTSAGLSIVKEVGDAVTILRLSGTLDARARFRWLADGVEGDVVIDFKGVTSVRSDGLKPLLRFLAEFQCDVHITSLSAELMGRLAGAPIAGAIRLVSAEGNARCAQCGTERVVRLGQDREGDTKPPLACCGQLLTGAATLERQLTGSRSRIRLEEIADYLRAFLE